MATKIQQILGLLGSSSSCCSFINAKRNGASPYSLSAALKEAFKEWEGNNTMPTIHLRMKASKHISLYIAAGNAWPTTHHTRGWTSPAWMDLV